MRRAQGYWFFYSFNYIVLSQSIPPIQGEYDLHEGDLEDVIVYTDAHDKPLVYTFYHHGKPFNYSAGDRRLASAPTATRDSIPPPTATRVSGRPCSPGSPTPPALHVDVSGSDWQLLDSQNNVISVQTPVRADCSTAPGAAPLSDPIGCPAG